MSKWNFSQLEHYKWKKQLINVFFYDIINDYIPLYNINIFEKFVIKKQEGFEYNMYLDYYKDENKTMICKIQVGNL